MLQILCRRDLFNSNKPMQDCAGALQANLQQGLVVGVRCNRRGPSTGFGDAIKRLIVQDQCICAKACDSYQNQKRGRGHHSCKRPYVRSRAYQSALARRCTYGRDMSTSKGPVDDGIPTCKGVDEAGALADAQQARASAWPPSHMGPI